MSGLLIDWNNLSSQLLFGMLRYDNSPSPGRETCTGSAAGVQLQTRQRSDEMQLIMTDRYQGHSALPYRPAPSYFIHKNRACSNSGQLFFFFFFLPSFMGPWRCLGPGAAARVAPLILTPLLPFNVVFITTTGLCIIYFITACPLNIKT